MARPGFTGAKAGVAIAACLIYSAYAGAQTAPAGPQTAAAPDTDRLEEVVVTAQKRRENISRVPMSITALTERDLDKEGIKDIEGIARVVPGLTLQPADYLGDTNISIRGITSNTGAAPTGIYIDEIPIQTRLTDITASNPYPKVFDLDRVEVLKGPQGTLFGAGSEGGTVRFITPDPSLDKYTGYGRAELAFTDGGQPSEELGAAFGGPIVDGKIGFRASAWERYDGGYIDRVSPTTGAVTDANTNWDLTKTARLAFILEPIDNLKITPAVFYQDEHQNDRDFYWESAGPFKSTYQIGQPRFDRFTLPSLSVEYDFPEFSVKSISSYFGRTIDNFTDATAFDLSAIVDQYGNSGHINLGSVPYLASGFYENTQKNFTEELRFTSTDQPGDKFSWVVGGYYQHNRQTIENYIVEPLETAIETLDPGYTVDTYFGSPMVGPYSYIQYAIYRESDLAGFVHGSYHITDDLKFDAGIRVARSGFDFLDQQNGPFNSGYTEGSGSKTETPVTPSYSLSYQIDPATMVYATAAKGYRIGGANESLATNVSCQGDLQTLGIKDVPLTYSSDTTWNYEFGTKARFFDNKLALTAAAFWIEWNRIQSQVFLPTCGYYYTGNLGRAVSKGFEAAAQWIVGGGFTLSGQVALTDARYTGSEYVASNIVAKKGDPLATPEWTATASGQYNFDWADNYAGYARADYDFSGSYYRTGSAETFSYDPYTRFQPATHYVTLRSGTVFGGWDISAFINNVLNSRTSLYRYHDTVNAAGFRDETFRPLTVGVTAEFRY